MRLLIVNPNTSAGVTRRIAAAAHAVAQPGDEFETISAAFGPELIVNAADQEEAARGVLEAAAPYARSVDGVVLASFGDTGAEIMRATYPGLAVIGIAGAAFGAAKALGGRFSIVSFGERLAPSLRAKAEEHRLGPSLEQILVVPGGDAGDPAIVQDVHREAIEQLCRRAAERPINSVVLGGGPLAGFAEQIADVRTPIIDGVQTAIGLLRGCKRTGVKR